MTRGKGKSRQFAKLRRIFEVRHRAVTLQPQKRRCPVLSSGLVGRSPATLEKRIPINRRRIWFYLLKSDLIASPVFSSPCSIAVPVVFKKDVALPAKVDDALCNPLNIELGSP